MRKFGKYILEELIGVGATAEVYRARDSALKRVVALKLLKPSLVTDENAFSRFMQEAQAAGSLFHSHLATVLEIGEAEGRYYIAMRYVDGRSLEQILKEEGPLSWEETLRMVQQVGAGLSEAHEEGFLHRDIKPANILRDHKGNYILTDFGLTRAMEDTGFTSHTNAVLGTQAYIAPEIWDSQPAGTAADQYALACVVVECLTGEVLFGAETPSGIMKKHLLDGPGFPNRWPEDVPPGLEKVLEKALAQAPGARHTSVAAMVGALEQSAAPPADEAEPRHPPSQERAQAPEPAPRTKPARPPSTPRTLPGMWMWVGGIMVAVSLIGFIWGLIHLIGGGTPADSQDDTQTPAVVFVSATPASDRPTVTFTPTDAIPSQIPSPTFTPTSPPERFTNPIDSAVYRYIPAGEFMMGSEDGGSDEVPIHPVYLDAFWIGQAEVTNGQYAVFLNEIGNQSEGGAPWLDADDEDARIHQPAGEWQADDGYTDHPAVEVSWYGAVAYCKWSGGQLPTEAQWEKAARGGLEGQRYPWGDESPTCTLGADNGAQYRTCNRGTVPVGSFAPNGYGVYDMAGNVWEWVGDWYDDDYYENSPYENPAGPEEGDYRVLRGGSWGSSPSTLRVAYRNFGNPDNSFDGIGFRCAFSRQP